MKMGKSAKTLLFFMTCFPKSHPLIGCFFPPQLIYESVHDPHAVRVDDKPNSSDTGGTFVRIGG